MNTTIKRGQVLATLLRLLDIASVSGLSGRRRTPAAIAISGGVLGVITTVAAALARRRGAIPTMIASRVISGLLSLPVYWADNVPGWSKTVVGTALAVTVAAIALLTVGLGPSARPEPRPTRVAEGRTCLIATRTRTPLDGRARLSSRLIGGTA